MRRILLLLGLASCAPQRLAAQADDDDLVIAVAHQGQNIRQAWIARHGVSSADLREDEDLTLLSVRGPDMELLTGGPRPTTLMPEVLVDASQGECPCLAPAARPLRISPGETCELPTFAETLEGDDSLKSRVSLHWPGSCPCKIERRDWGATAEAVAIDGVWPPSAAVLGDSGELVVMRQNALVQVRPTERELVPNAEAREATWSAQIPMARLGTSFVWAGHHPGRGPADQTLETVTQTGERSSVDFPFRIHDMMVHDGKLLIAGGTVEGEGRALICSDAKLETCQSLIPEEIRTWAFEYRRLEALASGAIAAFGEPVGIIFERVPTTAQLQGGESTLSDDGAFGTLHDASGGSTRWRAFHQFASGTDSYHDLELTEGLLVGCFARSNGTRFVLAVTTVDSRFFESTEPPDWREYDASGYVCFLYPSAPGRVIDRTGSQVIECNAEGCEKLEDDDRIFYATHEVALRPGIGVYRQDAALSPLYELEPMRPNVAFMVRSEGRIWAFDTEGGVRGVDGRAVMERTSVQFPGTPITGALDSTTGQVLVAGHGAGECGAWLGRWDLESRDFTSLVLQGDPCDPILEIEEASPGRMLALSRARVFRILGGEVESLPIQYDDPGTPETESRPTPCRVLGRATVRNPAQWNDIAASQGLGWIAGCSGTLFRVNLLADQPKVERVSFVGLDDTLGRGWSVELPAVGAACGSSALVAGPRGDAATSEVGIVVEVYPGGGARTETGILEPAFRIREDNLRAQSSRWIKSGDPIDIVGDPPLIVFGKSAHFLGSNNRAQFAGEWVVTANAEGPDGILMAGAGGGLFFLSYPD